MNVIKKINNNVAVCLDSNQNELIAIGKGIGFPAMPYELTDLSDIHRTYYGVNPSYLGLLNEISEEVFEVCAKIVDVGKNTIQNEVNPNIVFTLADHINFAIQRYHKNIVMKMPFTYDIQYLYEIEYALGVKAIDYIRKDLKIPLAKEEAIGIALHFINAQTMEQKSNDTMDEHTMIEDLTTLIEEEFKITIDRKGFNYSRFVTHLQYLLKRRTEDTEINSENKKMFDSMGNEFPKTKACVIKIRDYLKMKSNWSPGEEELLYLMLHINRLCNREDCYR